MANLISFLIITCLSCNKSDLERGRQKMTSFVCRLIDVMIQPESLCSLTFIQTIRNKMDEIDQQKIFSLSMLQSTLRTNLDFTPISRHPSGDFSPLLIVTYRERQFELVRASSREIKRAPLTSKTSHSSSSGRSFAALKEIVWSTIHLDQNQS